MDGCSVCDCHQVDSLAVIGAKDIYPTLVLILRTASEALVSASHEMVHRKYTDDQLSSILWFKLYIPLCCCTK